jgi:hypothetical protein
MSLRSPAQEEKGRLGLRFGENIEQPFGVARDPCRQAVPILAIDCRGNSLDLKIVLDVDRHRIRNLGAYTLRRICDQRRSGQAFSCG